MKKEIKNNINIFLDKMKKLDSFADVDTTVYIQSIRGKSRIIVNKYCLKNKV